MDFQLDPLHLTGHSVSLIALLLAWVGVLSPIMALLGTMAAFTYYMVAIYASKPFQDWLKKRRRRKMQRLQQQVNELKRLHGDED